MREKVAAVVRISEAWSGDLHPIVALKDKDASVRSAAAEALGKVGPVAQDASVALAAALKDDDAEVRRQAAIALRKLEKPRGLQRQLRREF